MRVRPHLDREASVHLVDGRSSGGGSCQHHAAQGLGARNAVHVSE